MHSNDTHKVWTQDSFHKTFEKADARRSELVSKGKKAERDVKIRRRHNGFAVKVWEGKTADVPMTRKERAAYAEAVEKGDVAPIA